jgi:hypothetical protein
MNRALLIAVCDFTILSLISIASFEPESSEGTQDSVEQPKVVSTLENDLFDRLKEDMASEQLERMRKADELEKEHQKALARQAELEEQRRLVEEKLEAERLSAQAKIEAERQRALEQQKELERQRELAQEQKKQLELERQSKAHQEAILAIERQKALAKQKELEALMQSDLEQAKALELAKQQAALTREQLEENKKQRQAELAKAKQDQQALAQNVSQLKEDVLRRQLEMEKLARETVALEAERARAEEQAEWIRSQSLQRQKELEEEKALAKTEAKRVEERARQREKELKEEKALAETEAKRVQERARQRQKELADALRQQETLAKTRQDQLLTTLMKKEEAQGDLLHQLREKDLEIEKTKSLLSQQERDLLEREQSFKVAQLKTELLEDRTQQLKASLEATRDQLKEGMKMSNGLARLEQKVDSQSEDLASRVENVVKQQTEAQQTVLAESVQAAVEASIDDARSLSTHEIFTLAQNKAMELTVKVTIQGLFGEKEEQKTFRGYPLLWDSGESRLLFHQDASPLAWSALRYDVLSFESNLNIPYVEWLQGAPEVCLSPLALSDHQQTLSVSMSPHQYESVVVVDLEKGAYARYPLLWDAKEDNIMLIQSNLAEQVFGPLSLKAGQMIFSDRGDVVGMMVSSKKGRWLREPTVSGRLNFGSSHALNADREARKNWLFPKTRD